MCHSSQTVPLQAGTRSFTDRTVVTFSRLIDKEFVNHLSHCQCIFSGSDETKIDMFLFSIQCLWDRVTLCVWWLQTNITFILPKPLISVTQAEQINLSVSQVTIHKHHSVETCVICCICCWRLQEKISLNWIKPNSPVTDQVKKGQACLHDKTYDCPGATDGWTLVIGHLSQKMVYSFPVQCHFIYVCEKESASSK